MLTQAELWEFRAMRAAVANAELRLEIARAACQAAAHRMVAAHGGDPGRPYEITDAGRIVQRTPEAPGDAQE